LSGSLPRTRPPNGEQRLTAELLDPDDPQLIEDPYPAYAGLRSHDPVAYLPAHDVWLICRHADALRVLRDPGTFSSKIGMSSQAADPPFGTGVGYRIGAPEVRVLIATDPPEHQVFRRAAAAAFTPSAIAQASVRVTAIAEACVQDVLSHRPAEAADLVSDLAGKLPVLVLAYLFGIPDDQQAAFRQWSAVITSDLGQHRPAQDRVGRGMEMFRYFSGQLRRAGDGPGPNLLHAIGQARGSGLSNREALAYCAFLLVAGIETTANLLSNMLAVLLHFPRLQQELRAHLDVLPVAVEEAIRYDTPVQALWRGTTESVELHGRRIPAGSRVLVLFGSANRDEYVFARAGEFVLDRTPNEHLGFGSGPHYCLGARLARLEVMAAIRSLLSATRWVEPAGPGVRVRSIVLRGFTNLPAHLHSRC
jgi:cytochrome P450